MTESYLKKFSFDFFIKFRVTQFKKIQYIKFANTQYEIKLKTIICSFPNPRAYSDNFIF